MKKEDKSAFYIFNLVIQFFLETFVSMAIGYFLGRWLDNLLFNERVIFTYIFVILGIFAGLRNLIVRTVKFDDEGDKDEE